MILSVQDQIAVERWLITATEVLTYYKEHLLDLATTLRLEYLDADLNRGILWLVFRTLGTSDLDAIYKLLGTQLFDWPGWELDPVFFAEEGSITAAVPFPYSINTTPGYITVKVNGGHLDVPFGLSGIEGFELEPGMWSTMEYNKAPIIAYLKYRPQREDQ